MLLKPLWTLFFNFAVPCRNRAKTVPCRPVPCQAKSWLLTLPPTPIYVSDLCWNSCRVMKYADTLSLYHLRPYLLVICVEIFVEWWNMQIVLPFNRIHSYILTIYVKIFVSDEYSNRFVLYCLYIYINNLCCNSCWMMKYVDRTVPFYRLHLYILIICVEIVVEW